MASSPPETTSHSAENAAEYAEPKPAVALGQDTNRASIVIVANRLPVRRVTDADGEHWKTSPGGLVSAMMPILQAQSEQGARGAWVGWTGDTGSHHDPFEHDGVQNIPVHIDSQLFHGFYEGMSNRSLWPLYHDVVRPPIYQRHWFRDYEAANRLFAAAAAEVAEEGAMVWVQDYHLHLVPRMLRERRPDLKIGFFLHIPFPGRGLFAQLPWRTQLIQGTLGADVVGFQSIYAARNFVDLATRYGDAEALPPNEKGEANRVKFDGREVTVDAYPISIETKKYDAIARSENVRGRAEEYRRRLPGRKIMLGVDRMDYTKGIDTRLRAFQDLLRSGRVHADEVVMIQSAVPTREGVDEYAELRSDVEELVGQINGEFGEVGRVAVQYLRQNLDIEDLVALYAAADVMLVTPLRDGMNLVAKEYVASHPDERGVLILSEFTGASNELTDALIVNPHDLDGLVNAMERAIRMEPEEVKRRQRALRRVVFEHDVHAWAASFMERLSA